MSNLIRREYLEGELSAEVCDEFVGAKIRSSRDGKIRGYECNSCNYVGYLGFFGFDGLENQCPSCRADGDQLISCSVRWIPPKGLEKLFKKTKNGKWVKVE